MASIIQTSNVCQSCYSPFLGDKCITCSMSPTTIKSKFCNAFLGNGEACKNKISKKRIDNKLETCGLCQDYTPTSCKLCKNMVAKHRTKTDSVTCGNCYENKQDFCTTVFAHGIRCSYMISKKAIEHGCTKCKSCRKKNGSMITGKRCGYDYGDGHKCKEIYLDYHEHCYNPSCYGNIYCELCSQCSICNPCCQ